MELSCTILGPTSAADVPGIGPTGASALVSSDASPVVLLGCYLKAKDQATFTSFMSTKAGSNKLNAEHAMSSK